VTTSTGSSVGYVYFLRGARVLVEPLAFLELRQRSPIDFQLAQITSFERKTLRRGRQMTFFLAVVLAVTAALGVSGVTDGELGATVLAGAIVGGWIAAFALWFVGELPWLAAWERVDVPRDA
jgi:hypothetical protein